MLIKLQYSLKRKLRETDDLARAILIDVVMTGITILWHGVELAKKIMKVGDDETGK